MPAGDEEIVRRAAERMSEEIGDTLFIRGRNCERATSLRRLCLKFEGGNPTGTQKDRVALALAREAALRGLSTITAGTCGNFGAALSYSASAFGLRTVIYIPERYRARRAEEMNRWGAEICRVEGEYEDSVELSRVEATLSGWFDANPGNGTTQLSLDAYGEIAREIVEELGDAPFAVAVPVGNGTTLAGIFQGFQRLYARGAVSRLPRMVAASTYQKNPIIKSFRLEHLVIQDLSPEEVRETEVNEPLVNWHSYNGQEALDALYLSGGSAEYASDQSMLNLSRLLREQEGIDVLPASTSGLAALLALHERGELPEDDHVAVLTGRRR